MRWVCGVAALPVAADLNHMRAVKLDKHNGFADENDMYSYFVSAKSGDNINSTFHRIAADWAGVVPTKPEVEITAVRGHTGGGVWWALLPWAAAGWVWLTACAGCAAGVALGWRAYPHACSGR
eukprot:COSAG01_NODE_28439_length_661_cov_0.850534_1_plen_123_part_00